MTGYERDNKTDLDYANPRYYRAPTGTFTSPDLLSFFGNVPSSTSLNAYAYARNDPLKFTDPSGMITDGDEPVEELDEPHAAERMVNPPPGRAQMTKELVDLVLDQGDNIRKITPPPEGTTVTVQNTRLPGKPQVVVDAATGKRIVTVINPRIKK